METMEELKKSIEETEKSYLPGEVDYPKNEKTEKKYFPTENEIDYFKITKSFEEEDIDTILDPFIGINRLPSGSIQFNKGNLLGEGAFGQVYHGRWNKRPVALKELDIKKAERKLGLSEGEVLEALQWEVTRLSTANHPNLVQFYGLYLDEGKTYLVTEYCEGGDLKKALARNPNWSKRWQWALEIAQGLAYLHHQGMLHRDLKAENILIDSQERARLADLGVAQVDALLQKEEASVVFKGLQDKVFAAPETLQDARISTFATDIYALGIVFWQLVVNGKKPATPRTPGGAIDVAKLLEHMQTGEREVIPEYCPVEFKELILHCWAFEPFKRPNIETILTRLKQLSLSSHSEPLWMQLCQQTDVLIHPKRTDVLSYIPSLVTEHRVQEDLDVYWQRLETLGATKVSEDNNNNNVEQSSVVKVGNPPLELKRIFAEFLAKPQSSTLLLLGESGLGKTLSIYQLANELLSQWWQYLANSKSSLKPYFPIFIRPTLTRWSYSELKDGFKKALEGYSLQAPLINWKEAPLLIIVDGYDECEADEEPHNLAEQLGIKDLPNIKVLVTCRPDTVAATSLRERFALKGQLITRYFLSFSIIQLLDYLNQGLHWDEKTHNAYQDKFEQSHSLRVVLRNPFVASLFVQSWETIKEKNFNQLNRWQIYEGFVEHWINTYHFLLSPGIKKTLTQHCKSETPLARLLESFNVFSAEIAFKVFQKQSITFDKQQQESFVYEATGLWLNLKEHIKKDSEQSFKERQKLLTRSGQRRALLNEKDYLKITEWRLQQFETASPLKNKEVLCEFSHKSFFEYFVAKRIVLLREKDRSSIVQEALELLNYRPIQSEAEVMVFLAEGWQEDKTRKLIEPFFEILEYSKKEGFTNVQASANAATTLNVGRVPFSGRDLSNICIPGADLSYGIFDGTQFKGANLSNVIFQGAWLREANLSDAVMEEVYFGEWSYQELPGYICIRNNPWNSMTQRSCSKDGFCLAAEENSIYLYAMSTRKLLRVFEGHTDWITSVIFSPDGKQFASGSDDNTLRLWDVTTGQMKAFKEHINGVKDIVFSPNSQQLAWASKDNTIKLWNYTTNQVKNFEGHADSIRCIVFSPDGYQLASGSEDNTIRLWDITSEKARIFEHEDWVTSIAFSPDGRWLVAGSVDTTIHLWNINTETHIRTFKWYTLPVLSVAFNSNGQQMASGDADGNICLWDVATGVLVKTFEGHARFVDYIAFSPDDCQVISKSEEDNTVRRWNIGKDKNVQLRRFNGHTSEVQSIAFSSNGRQLASGSGDIIFLWDTTTASIIKAFEKNGSRIIRCIVFSPDGHQLVSQGLDGTIIELWDIATGNLVQMLKGHTDFITSITFSPDGRQLASGSHDKTLCLWDIATGALVKTFEGHTSFIHSIAFSPNGQWLISASGSLSVGINNRTRSDDATIRLWDVATGALVKIFEGHTNEVLCVAFSSDSRYFASVSSDSTVRLWEVATGKSTIFKGHKQPYTVNSIAFSPDGCQMVSGSADNTLRFWDIITGKCIVTYQLNTSINSVGWIKTEQGTFLATGSNDKSVRYWRVENQKDTIHLRLLWSSYQAALSASNTNLEGVQGLSADNVALLKQRGAVGEPLIIDESLNDVQDYFQKYSKNQARKWQDWKRYQQVLDEIPRLKNLITNSFMINLVIEVLPQIVEHYQNQKFLQSRQLTQATLYDIFIKQWFWHQEQILKNSKQIGIEEDIKPEFLAYAKALAQRMHQRGVTQVVYEEAELNLFSKVETFNPWKNFFNPQDPRIGLLKAACLIQEISPHHYAFIHESLLDYFLAQNLYDNLSNSLNIEKEKKGFLPLMGSSISLMTSDKISNWQENYFNQRLLVKESNIVQFLADRICEQEMFKQTLFKWIYASRDNPEIGIAAANAITVLNHAGVSFSGFDLQGIRIPEADLSYGMLDHANLQNADLSNANLQNAWLRGTDFRRTNLTDVQFGEGPYLSHENSVQSIAYSSDGRWLAIASGKDIILRDVISGELQLSLKSHTYFVTSIAFSPDDKTLASGSVDTTVKLWELDSGKVLHSLDHIAIVESIAFSPDGKTLASACRDPVVKLWETESGKEIRTLEGHTGLVKSVAFSPDGKTLASGSWDKTIKLWEIESGKVCTLGGHNAVESIAFSPDGKILASGSDSTIKLWEADSGKMVRTLKVGNHTSTILSIAFSPDGKILACGSMDKTVKLWEPESGKEVRTLYGHTGEVRSVAFSPDGKILASGSRDNTVKLWDPESVKEARALEGHTDWVLSVAFSADGKTLASGNSDSTIKLWKPESGKEIHTLKGHTRPIWSIAFSPNSKTLASGSYDSTVKLWETESGKEVRTLGHTSEVHSVAFRPCGKILASGSCDKTIKLWDIESGKEISKIKGHINSIESIAFSPDGKTLASSGSLDKTIKLWDIESGKEVGKLEGHINSIESIVFSPDGKTLASGSLDATVKLWDPKSGKEILTLKGHTAAVKSIAFSLDGKTLASGSLDATIKLWDITNGQILHSLAGYLGGIDSIAWHQDLLVSGSRDKSVKVWKIQKNVSLPLSCILIWSSHVKLLYAEGCQLGQALLSPLNTLLLKQKGAIGYPLISASDHPGWNALHLAVANNNKELLVHYVQEHKISIDDKTCEGETALHIAVRYQAIEVIEYLLSRDADALAHNAQGKCPGNLAFDLGYKNLLDYLPMEDKEHPDQTPLHLAIENGSEQMVAYLLKQKKLKKFKCDIDAPNHQDQTPLLLAVIKGNSQIAMFLLEEGANPYAIKLKKNNTLLHWAAEENHGKILEILLNTKINIEIKNDDGATAVHIAALNNHVEALKLLKIRGANLLAKTNLGNTPLHRAVANSCVESVEWLLEQEVPIEIKNNSNETAVHVAAYQSHIEILKLLNERGADLLVKDKRGNTALHRAAVNNGINAVIWLLEQGLPIEIRNDYDETALHVAAYHNQVEVLKLLKERGADLFAKDKEGNTALHRAAVNNGINAIIWLLEQGLPIEIRNDDGATSAHVAVYQNQLKILELLRAKGADLLAKDNLGNTPLHWAVARNQIEAAEWLLEQGAPIEIKNDNGETAIHVAACYCNQVEILKLLKAHGSNLLARENTTGGTPLHRAAAANAVEAVKWLLEQGSPIDILRDDECTPLHRAAYNGQKETVELLLQKGANSLALTQAGKTPAQLARDNNKNEIAKLIEEYAETTGLKSFKPQPIESNVSFAILSIGKLQVEPLPHPPTQNVQQKSISLMENIEQKMIPSKNMLTTVPTKPKSVIKPVVIPPVFSSLHDKPILPAKPKPDIHPVKIPLVFSSLERKQSPISIKQKETKPLLGTLKNRQNLNH